MIRNSLRDNLASVRLLIFGIPVGLTVILLGIGSAASDNQHSNAIPSTNLASNRNTPPLYNGPVKPDTKQSRLKVESRSCENNTVLTSRPSSCWKC